jgi:mannose-6-phosphate isomerase-like protein (cupin superfamily)
VSRYGDFYENRVTGERVVVLRGPDDIAAGQTGLAHLTVSPHGAVAGEHVHPHIQERFVVISGVLGTRLDGVERDLHAGEEATATPGMPHDWWNAGEEDANVLVELDGPPEHRPRFEAMIATIFGLANEGRTNAKGLPHPLQLALLAREFDDVIRFTRPPRAVQIPLFAVLGALGRARGLRPTYPQHLHPHGRTSPDPEVLEWAGITAPVESHLTRRGRHTPRT